MSGVYYICLLLSYISMNPKKSYYWIKIFLYPGIFVPKARPPHFFSNFIYFDHRNDSLLCQSHMWKIKLSRNLLQTWWLKCTTPNLNLVTFFITIRRHFLIFNFKILQILKNTRISIVQNVDGEKHKYTYEMWEYLTDIVISENLWTARKGFRQYK